MTYLIRDNCGVLKLMLSDESSQFIISKGVGFFRKCTYPNCVGDVGYEFNKDFELKLGDGVFFFWKGDTLYKNAVLKTVF